MNEVAYQAALEGAALYDEAAYGRIRMRGESAADLLHRLSTNDILKLRPGHGLRTVLTTPIGRIIDLLTVYALDDSLLLITSPGQGAAVFSHLRKNIFFNDKVTLEPLARSHGQLALYGPAAPDVLARLAEFSPADLPLNAITRATLAGSDVQIARALPIGGQGFRLLVPADALEAVRAALLGGAVPLDEATFDVLRVEQGYGAVGRELSQEYIPLETGLADAISFTKGCYVGQEIIARMESRGRLAKTLSGLRLTVEGGPSTLDDSNGTTVDGLSSTVVPAKLALDGKDVGDLTSAVQSPRFGPIGLAYVRTAHAEAGTRVSIANTGLTGEVVALPFA